MKTKRRKSTVAKDVSHAPQSRPRSPAPVASQFIRTHREKQSRTHSDDEEEKPRTFLIWIISDLLMIQQNLLNPWQRTKDSTAKAGPASLESSIPKRTSPKPTCSANTLLRKRSHLDSGNLVIMIIQTLIIPRRTLMN
jgi:hypothetical protein